MYNCFSMQLFQSSCQCFKHTITILISSEIMLAMVGIPVTVDFVVFGKKKKVPLKPFFALYIMNRLQINIELKIYIYSVEINKDLITKRKIHSSFML